MGLSSHWGSLIRLHSCRKTISTPQREVFHQDSFTSMLQPSCHKSLCLFSLQCLPFLDNWVCREWTGERERGLFASERRKWKAWKIIAWLPKEIPGAHGWCAGLGAAAGWWQPAETGGRSSERNALHFLKKLKWLHALPSFAGMETISPQNDRMTTDW